MRLARAIAMFVIFGLLLISNFKQPVRAFSCQDDCSTAYSNCNNQVDGTYQSCIGDCDALYPWWSGCQNYCFSNREAGWAQCESDYNSCLSGCP